MTFRICSIWRKLPPDLPSKIQGSLDTGCANLSVNAPGHVFLRDDDVAAPGRQFAQLMALFSQLRIPLNLALVPAWLTRARWQCIQPSDPSLTGLWCWHQHGWRHKNHAPDGKKQEFGPARSTADLQHDVLRGRQRLESLIGDDFYPVFTPPWNRCDQRTLRLLRKHGFLAVSRSQNPNNSSFKGLPDFCVNLDLHTRKDRHYRSGWMNLFDELQRQIASGMCGIMIHHNRMNMAAFDFLKMLLEMIMARKELRVVSFRELARIRKGSRFKVQGSGLPKSDIRNCQTMNPKP